MAIAGFGGRSKLYSDVLAFPATKSSGALTLYSSILYPFEDGAYGPARISLYAANRGALGTLTGQGDTIDVNVYVSFSHGDSWFRVMTLRDLHRADSLAPFAMSYILPLAPRVKLTADFAAADSLVAGHGCKVDVEFQEMYSGAKRASYIEDVKTATYGFVGDTKAGIRGTGIPPADSRWVRTSTALDCGFAPSRIFVWGFADDVTRVSRPLNSADSYFNYTIQTSTDGVAWVHGDSLRVSRIGAVPNLFGQNMFNGAEEINAQFLPVTTNPTATGFTPWYYRTLTGYPGRFGNYLRLRAWGDTTSDMRRGHGTRFHLIAFE
jgi:hypothetical protein